MGLSQQVLDKEDKLSNINNSEYHQLRVDIFKLLNELSYLKEFYPPALSEKQVELVTEDIMEIVDNWRKNNERTI